MGVALELPRNGDVPRQSATLKLKGFFAVSWHMALSFFNKKKKEKKEVEGAVEGHWNRGGSICKVPRPIMCLARAIFPFKNNVALCRGTLKRMCHEISKSLNSLCSRFAGSATL